MVDRQEQPIAAEIGLDELGLDRADRVFADQDSGCLSYGVSARGHRWFVKVPKSEIGARSLRSSVGFHAAIQHPAIIAPVRVFESPSPAPVAIPGPIPSPITGPMLLYPWIPGQVLNQANVTGSDRRALDRFQRLELQPVQLAITTVLDAHRHIAERGFVAVDFYDGALLYDFDALTMRLIDLDDYRPGPFALDRDRLPGSLRYMAPEEFRRGAVIDQRTNVFTLGRMIHHLLDGPSDSHSRGWRGSAVQAALVERATAESPADRFQSIADLTAAWSDSISSPEA